MPVSQSAIDFMSALVDRVRRMQPKKRIVFPEAHDPRIVAAAEMLLQDGLAQPILIGPKPASASPALTFIDPDHCASLKKYAGIFFERRRSRGVTEMEALATARKPLYFANLMVAAGDADGNVGGVANSTAVTFRSAIHCIGPQPKVRVVSSFYIMALHDRSFGHNGLVAMGDCSIVAEPSAVELAEIAISTAQSVRALMNTEPAVALLSFSTKGSAKHKMVDKVAEALRIIRARDPGLHVDGELQADAALVPSIGRSKSPGSTVAGQANTLIFPDLNAANIGYKLVERLADATAIGPFIQGLAKPANDISRGCSPEDIYNLAVITAVQADDARAGLR